MQAFFSSTQIQGVYLLQPELSYQEYTNRDSGPAAVVLEYLSHFDKGSVDLEFLVLLSSGKEIDWSVRANEDGLTSHHVQGAIGPLYFALAASDDSDAWSIYCAVYFCLSRREGRVHHAELENRGVVKSRCRGI